MPERVKSYTFTGIPLYSVPESSAVSIHNITQERDCQISSLIYPVQFLDSTAVPHSCRKDVLTIPEASESYSTAPG